MPFSDSCTGVWADATVLCRRPLDEWIHAAAAPADGFFAFGPEKGPGALGHCVAEAMDYNDISQNSQLLAAMQARKFRSCRLTTGFRLIQTIVGSSEQQSRPKPRSICAEVSFMSEHAVPYAIAVHTCYAAIPSEQ